MKLVLSLKTKRHNWKWNINRTLELLSYPLFGVLLWTSLVLVIGYAPDIALM